MTKGGLSKSERIYLRDEIEALFRSREGFVSYPVRLLYLLAPRTEGESPLKLLISVPKKRLRHAVDRNRVKRLFREAVRLRKALFAEAIPPETALHLALVYISDDVCSYRDASKAVEKAAAKLADRLSPSPEVPDPQAV